MLVLMPDAQFEGPPEIEERILGPGVRLALHRARHAASIPDAAWRTAEGILAWHIDEGHYGAVDLSGLSVVALGSFTGNLWAGAKAQMALYIDERANADQQQALQAIWGGNAGGWMAGFAGLVETMRGVATARIDFEVAEDLSSWRVEIPGVALGEAQALGGPTTPPHMPGGGGGACTLNTERWCDDFVYCSWGKQRCLPTGQWGPCTEPSFWATWKSIVQGRSASVIVS